MIFAFVLISTLVFGALATLAAWGLLFGFDPDFPTPGGLLVAVVLAAHTLLGFACLGALS